MAASSGAFAAGVGTGGSRAQAIAQDSLNYGSIIEVVLYLAAGVFFIMFVAGLFRLGRGNNSGTTFLGVLLCLFASVAAASAGTVVMMGSQTVFGTAPSITGASTQPLQFQ